MYKEKIIYVLNKMQKMFILKDQIFLVPCYIEGEKIRWIIILGNPFSFYKKRN